MNGTPLGGLLKIALAGVLAWAWVNGHLATVVGEVLGQFGGATATTASTTATGSSSTGATA